MSANRLAGRLRAAGREAEGVDLYDVAALTETEHGAAETS